MSVNQLQGHQVRAARAILDWSVRQLAQISEVSESSIRRIESSFGVPENVSLDLLMRLREFFEARGFTFLFDGDEGSGVRYRRRIERRHAERRRGG